ncbi:MAG: LysE family transporter [Candidatus Aminicenantes bacterium]|nr:LysE family transporter [Candidatus Aminicenantes bacterium]
MSLAFFGSAVFLATVLVGLPVGPVQMEIWRHSLVGNRRRAAAFLAGAVAGDVGLGLISTAGLNPWSRLGRAGGVAHIVFAILLVVLGMRSIRCPSGQGEISPADGLSRRRRWAALQGWALITFNPLGIATWALILTAIARLGARLPSGIGGYAVFVLAVIAGTSAYPVLIILFAPRLVGRLAPFVQTIVPRLFGAGILVFGLYFLYRAVLLLAGS